MEIEEYKELVNKLKKEFKDKDIVIAVLQEIGKDRRVGIINKEKQGKDWKNEPATPKQLAMLEKMGLKVPENCTKFEVSKIIEENKKYL